MIDILAAGILAFWWTGSDSLSAGIRVDRRSVSEAWPNSTDEADDRAYKLLMELGNDPALIALMQRYHLKTGSLKELGPHDAQYVYEIKKTEFGIETRIEEGYKSHSAFWTLGRSRFRVHCSEDPCSPWGHRLEISQGAPNTAARAGPLPL